MTKALVCLNGRGGLVVWHTFPAKAYPALAHTPPRFFVMTKKFLVMMET